MKHSLDSTYATEETEQYFQRNTVFMKIRQQSLLSQIRKLQKVIDLSKHSNIDFSTIQHTLTTLQTQIASLNPVEESANDITNGTPLSSDSRRSTDTQQFEYRMRKIVEQYEKLILQKELQHEEGQLAKLQDQILRDIEERYQYLTFTDEQDEKNVELVRYYLSKEDCPSDYYKGLRMYFSSYQALDLRYQQEVMNLIRGIIDELILVRHTLNTHQESLTERKTEFEQMKYQLDMAAMSHPSRSQPINEIKKEISQMFTMVKSKLQDIQNRVDTLTQSLQQHIAENDLSYQQLKDFIQTIKRELILIGDNQIKELQAITDAGFRVTIFKAIILIHKSDMFEAISYFIDLNQDTTSQVSELGGNYQAGLMIEESLLKINEDLETIENNKGFVEEADSQQVEQQTLQIFKESFIPLSNLKEELLRGIQVKQQIQDIDSLLEEQQQIYHTQLRICQTIQSVFKANEDFQNVIRSTDSAMVRIDTTEMLKLWNACRVSFQESDKFYKESLQTRFTSVIQTMLGVQPILESQINQCFQSLIQLKTQQEQLLVQLEQILFDLKEQLPHQFSPKTIPITNYHPVIVSNNIDLIDQLLLKMLAEETSKMIVNSSNKGLKFPVFYRMQQADTSEVALYEMRSFTGSSFSECFKVKLIEDNDLVIKMRCGAYMCADKIGHYYQELLFKAGVEILTTESF